MLGPRNRSPIATITSLHCLSSLPPLSSLSSLSPHPPSSLSYIASVAPIDPLSSPFTDDVGGFAYPALWPLLVLGPPNPNPTPSISPPHTSQSPFLVSPGDFAYSVLRGPFSVPTLPTPPSFRLPALSPLLPHPSTSPTPPLCRRPFAFYHDIVLDILRHLLILPLFRVTNFITCYIDGTIAQSINQSVAGG